jgi:hypothetical protein
LISEPSLGAVFHSFVSLIVDLPFSVLRILALTEPAGDGGAFLFDAAFRHRYGCGDTDLQLPGGLSPAIAIRGWCCGGARGRDRTLRLPVIRLRPRAFCASRCSTMPRLLTSRSRSPPPRPGPRPAGSRGSGGVRRAASNLNPGGPSLRAAVPATPTRDREPSRLKSDQRNPAARDADEPAH